MSSCLTLALVVFLLTKTVHSHFLKEGFYSKSCPSAEAVVKSTVQKFVATDPGLPAALIRLHFHDCFVRGCDASILIESTLGNDAEKSSPVNKALDGFDMIAAAKTKLESLCPNTVSCADIIAFAARDSVRIAKGMHYNVPAGRRDGTISLATEVSRNIPRETFNVRKLKTSFVSKGLSLTEMVILSGAHSIGEAHCSAFSNRLSGFNSTFEVDPSLAPSEAKLLRATCSRNESDTTVSLNRETPFLLDNNYYKQLKAWKGVLFSDQVLWETTSSRNFVKLFIEQPEVWAIEFKAAMIRMGKIQVLTGKKGQIRKKCSMINGI